MSLLFSGFKRKNKIQEPYKNVYIGNGVKYIYSMWFFFPPVEESLVIVPWPGYILINPKDLWELIYYVRMSDSLGGKRPSGKMSAHACDARENLRAQTNKEWEWQYFHASYLHISPLWVITHYHETGKSKACYQSGTRWCTSFRRNANKTFAMMAGNLVLTTGLKT